jgi:hypothetical protein
LRLGYKSGGGRHGEVRRARLGRKRGRRSQDGAVGRGGRHGRQGRAVVLHDRGVIHRDGRSGGWGLGALEWSRLTAGNKHQTANPCQQAQARAHRIADCGLRIADWTDLPGHGESQKRC